MDYRAVLLCCLGVLLALAITVVEGRNKKVVIHVPYKVKKVKHTHTVYKTIHHHHTHREPVHHVPALEEHEHFHHTHFHDELPSGQHSQPIPEIGIPNFLPDVPMELPIHVPDAHVDLPSRMLPLYRRA